MKNQGCIVYPHSLDCYVKLLLLRAPAYTGRVFVQSIVVESSR